MNRQSSHGTHPRLIGIWAFQIRSWRCRTPPTRDYLWSLRERFVIPCFGHVSICRRESRGEILIKPAKLVDLLVNEIVAEPEILRQTAKSESVLVPRPVEVLRRIEVIPLLNDGPSCALGWILAVLLVEIFSLFIKLSFYAERVNATPARRQLKAVRFLRLDVFSRNASGVKINCIFSFNWKILPRTCWSSVGKFNQVQRDFSALYDSFHRKQC